MVLMHHNFQHPVILQDLFQLVSDSASLFREQKVLKLTGTKPEALNNAVQLKTSANTRRLPHFKSRLP